MDNNVLIESIDPVETVETGSIHREVETGMGLCLSGGGYRAMLFLKHQPMKIAWVHHAHLALIRPEPVSFR